MSMNGKWNAHLLLAITAACGVTFQASAQPQVRAEEWPRSVVWESSATGSAIFLPESMFDSLTIEELPLSDEDRKSLALRLEVLRDPARFYHPMVIERMTGCIEPTHSARRGSDPETYPIEEVLARSIVVYMGQVEEVTPGLSLLLPAHPALAATIRVDRVAASEGEEGSNNLAKPGERRTIIFHGGRVNLWGTELCFTPVSGFYRPKVGDWIITGGVQTANEPLYFRHSTVFPIVGELVQPEPYSFLSEKAQHRNLGYVWDYVLSRKGLEK